MLSETEGIVLERHRTLACRPRRRPRPRSVRQHVSPDFRLRERGRRRGRESIYQAFQAFTIYVSALKLPRRGPLFRAQSRKKLRSLKVISLLSMQKKLAKDIFTLKKDGAKRHQQIFNFQSSIFNSGLSGWGTCNRLDWTGSPPWTPNFAGVAQTLDRLDSIIISWPFSI